MIIGRLSLTNSCWKPQRLFRNSRGFKLIGEEADECKTLRGKSSLWGFRGGSEKFLFGSRVGSVCQNRYRFLFREAKRVWLCRNVLRRRGSEGDLTAQRETPDGTALDCERSQTPEKRRGFIRGKTGQEQVTLTYVRKRRIDCPWRLRFK